MIYLTLKTLFWFIFALALAGVEIEAEGPNGWAEKMPTWYKVTPWYAKLYAKILGGRPLTGYHTFQFFIPLLMFHAHFFMGTTWSISAELIAIAMYVTIMALWDFLWFVLNPWYGWENFRPKNVWWHNTGGKWFLNLPIDYYFAWILSLALTGIASYLNHDWNIVYIHAGMLFAFAILTLITANLAFLYRNWYWTMRKVDERDLIIPTVWNKQYKSTE